MRSFFFFPNSSQDGHLLSTVYTELCSQSRGAEIDKVSCWSEWVFDNTFNKQMNIRLKIYNNHNCVPANDHQKYFS